MSETRPWGIHTIHRMFAGPGTQAGLPDGRWVTAVAEPYVPGLFGRIAAAWWVVTGRAHAVIWPAPGDLEAVLGKPIPHQENT
jgi:hypothetical protein